MQPRWTNPVPQTMQRHAGYHWPRQAPSIVPSDRPADEANETRPFAEQTDQSSDKA